MDSIFLHALVTALACGIVLSTDVPEFSKGIKVGKLPHGSHLLETSITYDDRLYTTSFSQLLVLDKSTGSIKFSMDLASGPGIDRTWDSITVGPCSANNDDKNCVYLGYIEKELLRITKFEEPAEVPPLGEYLTTQEEDLSVQLHLYAPLSLQILVDQQAKVWTVLRYDDSYFLSFLENYEGTASGGRLSEMQEIYFQQPIDIESVSWDITESIILTSSEGFVYLFTNEGDITSPMDILTGKPHILTLHGGHRHKQTSVCWDQHTTAIYSMARGRHASVFRFEQAQSDEGYSRDERGNCIDKNRYCTQWAQNKMCEKRKEYMTINCPIACDLCSENKRLQDMPSCLDRNQLCSEWAGQGKCKGESREYMQQNCRKSCNLCLQSKSQCQDLSTSCKSWASIGRCQTRKVFMEENCAASCKLCKDNADNNNLQNDQGSSSSVGTPVSGCKDLSEYCGQWAEAEYCETRKDYMFLNCPSSCGLCGTKRGEQTQIKEKSKCKDGSKFCMVWAANGLCEANKVYMDMNCKFACSSCKRETLPRSYGCEDAYDDCPTWAKYDLCQLNTGFMNKGCRKSCGKCDKDVDNRIIQEVSQRVPQREYGALRETGSCRDNSEHCEIWAKNEYCTINSAHMNVTCRKTCGLCTGSSAEIVISTTTAKPTTRRQYRPQNAVEVTKNEGECKDESDACGAWAKRDYCQTRSSVMNKYCPVTCGVCGQVAKSKTIATSKPITRRPMTTTPTPKTEIQLEHRGTCRDKERMCPVWKAAGRCESNKEEMSRNCPFSCNLCSNGPQQSTCVDKNDYCAAWASQGTKCQLYMGYMKANCAKSCRFCGSVNSERSSHYKSTDTMKQQTEECKDERSHCEVWASNDYCKIRKDFMNRYCKKSCGVC